MNRFFKITVLAVITLVLMVSCGKDTVYQSRYSFDNYSWDRLSNKNTVTFDNIEIKDTSSVYNIIVTVRHTPYINENQIKFLLSITSEDGIKRISTHTIKLKDEVNQKWLGDAAGDLIDIESRCKSFTSFQSKGKYKISLTNLGSYVKLIGILDIGIKIEKTNPKKYNDAG